MAISFVGYQTAVGSASSVSTTLVSGTIQNGDLLIVALTTGNSGSATLTVTDTDLPWTAFAHINTADTIDANLDVAYAIATSSLPASISVSTGTKAVVLYVFRGVDQTTPMDATSTSSSTASTSAANPAAITPTSADSVIVAIGSFGHEGDSGVSTGDFTAGPSGYSNFVNLNNWVSPSANYQSNVGLAWKQSTGASSQDPGVFTASATNIKWGSASRTLALKMAAATGKTIAAGVDSYSMSGVAAGTKLGRKVAAGTNAYQMTGTAAGLKKGKILAAGVGSYQMTGSTSGIKHGWKTPAGVGFYAMSGVTVPLKHGFKAPAGVSSYAMDGIAVPLKHGFKIPAGVGSYAMSGVAAPLKHGFKVPAGISSYAMDGVAADIKHGLKPVEMVLNFSMPMMGM